MKILLAFLTLVASLFIANIAPAQVPTVSSPTNGQVFYNGDTMNIKWQSYGSGKSENVWIMLRMTGTDEGTWIAAYVTNTGSFTWTATNINVSHTNFSITVMDSYVSEPVNIVLINGTRPPPPSTIDSITQVGSGQGYIVIDVYGTCEPGYTNYLQYSTDMHSWNSYTNVPESPTDGQLGWEVTTYEPKLFFRVDTQYAPNN